jgi:hypothetical protein
MLSTKKAMTYGVENPSPGLVQAQKCGRVKHDISIPTLPPLKLSYKYLNGSNVVCIIVFICYLFCCD